MSALMTTGVEVLSLETPGLGDRTYLVTDGDTALVIDPQRDIDRVIELARDRGVRITHVAETHIHNDYVSGGLALARAARATYVVAAADRVSFPRLGVKDGDLFEVGTMTVRVLATPGHTPNHLAYAVGRDGQPPVGLFTGGSMLFGAVGRTDLVDTGLTEVLTRDQFRSVRRLAQTHPDSTRIYPTHGFGSFCSATPATIADASDIGTERGSNPALTTQDEEQFVKQILAGLTPYPRYYAHMACLNLAGAFPPDLSPPAPVGIEELLARIRAHGWVVDLRPRVEYAGSHLRGTVNVEVRSQDFASYLGWILPWGTELTLIAGSHEQVAKAQRELARIGIDRPAGAWIFDPGALPADARHAYEVADFARLHAEAGAATVLDVRHPHEWRAGHVDGALHVPFEELPGRLDEVPAGEVWVYCRSGMRAAIAASLLDDGTRRVVLVDDRIEHAPSG